MNNDGRNDAATDDATDSGIWSEDWLATIVGLAILAFALLGLIPTPLLW